jgi:hypothetical protein
MNLDEARVSIGKPVMVLCEGKYLVGKLMSINSTTGTSDSYWAHVDLAAQSQSFPLADVKLKEESVDERAEAQGGGGMSDCMHPRLAEIPSSTVRWVSTPQWVEVGEEIKTEPLPKGIRVLQCWDCKKVFIEEGK